MIQPRITEQLKILQEGIRLDAPLVANFFETTTPLLEYSKKLHQYEAQPEHRERQSHFKSAVRELLRQIFDESELAKANINWEGDWKINIVDHQGFLNHPILVATNIIGNMYQLPSDKPEGVIVLSDSAVPFNNFFHKRGLKFSGKQINIFSHKERHIIAYTAPTKINFPLTQNAQQSGFSIEEMEFLHRVEKQLNSTANHSKVRSYSDQITRANYEMWPLLFSDDIRNNIPGLFYVSNEATTAALLPQYLQDTQNIFYRILFDEPTRNKFIDYFNGITGCWDKDVKKGSHFFWGLSDEGEGVNLAVRNNKLVSTDEHNPMEIKLTPEDILGALRDKKIYPGMFIVYGIAIFYCGICPLVGYGSMNYQTRMKLAWIKTMQAVEPSEVPLLEHIPTDGFIGGPKVAFAVDKSGFVELYALDIMYRGGLSKEYLERLREMPFNALLAPALIDIYESYVKPERKQKISIKSGELMGESFSWLKNMRV